jgi:tetratricopeptide (TPR) repeat protein
MGAMRVVVLTCLLGFVSGAEAASTLDNPAIAGNGRYERCLTLTRKDPAAAITAAEAWRNAGGGPAALHCDALALVALHRYVEAAPLLERAAAVVAKNGKDMGATLYDQAANAWLLAGETRSAETAIDSALVLSPRDEDILFDRARVRAAAKNWTGAVADLGTLLTLDPNRADALVLRSSARHALGQKADAESDLAHALQIYPDYPEALVERGVMKLETGDRNGARADWSRVVHDAPGGDAAAAARAHLAELGTSKGK